MSRIHLFTENGLAVFSTASEIGYRDLSLLMQVLLMQLSEGSSQG